MSKVRGTVTEWRTAAHPQDMQAKQIATQRHLHNPGKSGKVQLSKTATPAQPKTSHDAPARESRWLIRRPRLARESGRASFPLNLPSTAYEPRVQLRGQVGLPSGIPTRSARYSRTGVPRKAGSCRSEHVAIARSKGPPFSERSRKREHGERKTNYPPGVNGRGECFYRLPQNP